MLDDSVLGPPALSHQVEGAVRLCVSPVLLVEGGQVLGADVGPVGRHFVSARTLTLNLKSYWMSEAKG